MTTPPDAGTGSTPPDKLPSLGDKLCGASCAHLSLNRIETYYFGGSRGSHWQCAACGIRFVPSFSPPAQIAAISACKQEEGDE